jgi:hypothetical protein
LIETYAIDVVVRRHQRDALGLPRARGVTSTRSNNALRWRGASFRHCTLHVAGYATMYGVSRPNLGLPCDNAALALCSREVYRGEQVG